MDQTVFLLLISNIVAILQLTAAVKWPRLAKVSFFLLFGWACWINRKTAHQNPTDYLNYASLAWTHYYKNFINGWFSRHIEQAVGFIAICQGLIAIAFLLKGWVFKMGCIAAIVFLLAIVPLGIGSGFPCTAIMAIALFILQKKHGSNFVWRNNTLAT